MASTRRIKHILVTGHNGFIGSRLVAEFAQMPKVTVDLAKYPYDVNALNLQLEQVDAIYLLGGKKGCYKIEQGLGMSDYEHNLKPILQLCEMLKDVPNKPLIIFASSFQVNEIRNSYALAKFGAEAALQMYAIMFGWKAVAVRLPHIFGNTGRRNLGALDRLMRDIKDGVWEWNGEPQLIWPVLHIDTLVDWLTTLITPKGIKAYFPDPDKHGYIAINTADIPQVQVYNLYKLAELIAGPPVRTHKVSEIYELMTQRNCLSIYLQNKVQEKALKNLVASAQPAATILPPDPPPEANAEPAYQ